MPQNPLPESNLNIGALARVFDDKSASYKFLWTLALVKEAKDETAEWTPFYRLCRSMLADSLIPISRFKLLFGYRDQMNDKWQRIARINSINTAQTLDGFELSSAHEETVRKVCDELAAKVPHRWLSPFLKEQLAGLHNPTRTESVVRNKITECARDAFNDDSPPPYKLDGKGIVLHPLWRDYFKHNYEIVRGWILWHWTNYLQMQNPTIPNIAEKVAFPEGRGDMNKQRDFWGDAIKRGGFACIYSTAAIDALNFDLDHYVPWSFIGHNHIWNLAPVEPNANRQKSNILPHDDYFADFVGAHYLALKTREQFFPRKHRDMIEEYRSGLHIKENDLCDRQKLRAAYERIIPPLIEIAKANSFRSEWRYNAQEKQ